MLNSHLPQQRHLYRMPGNKDHPPTTNDRNTPGADPATTIGKRQVKNDIRRRSNIQPQPPSSHDPPQKKKQKTPAPLYRPQYPKKSRQLMIDLPAPLPAALTDLQILTTVNQVVHRQKCLQPHRLMKGNVMILTPPNFAATDALKLSARIVDAISDLGIMANTPRINGKWSQFLIDGVPTTYPTGGEILDEIAETCDDWVTGMKLAQRQRWLASPANSE